MIAGTATRRALAVPSAGRTLTVAATSSLIQDWPLIAPHVPGVPLHQPPHPTPTAAVVVPGDTSDARRLINAHLHVLHLAAGTLSVHAVALYRPDTGAVLLLGGHGAGKTLVGVALAMHGWQWLAGDVTLLDIATEGGIVVRGGTSAVLGRRTPVRRWFPELGLPTAGPETVDLTSHDGRLAVTPAPAPKVVAAVLVDVDGDPAAADGTLRRIDRHTAETVWLKASSHLLDRVLNNRQQVLRMLEDEPAQRRRIHYVHALAEGLGVHAAHGAPQGVAARVEHLATTGGQGVST